MPNERGTGIMIKQIKSRGNYFIISNDEPYIEKLYEVFKKGLDSRARQKRVDACPEKTDNRRGNVNPAANSCP